MKTFRSYRLWLLLLILPLTGCLFRSHKIKPQTMSTAPLQSATAGDLVSWLNQHANSIKTMNATVDIATSVGGVKKGKVTEYQEIRGYILIRQPHLLRMIGLAPVVRTRAFDMVSDGSEFKLYIPPKNKFYVGSNNVVAPGATGLTALRPQIIYDALLLNDINPQQDIAVLEAGAERVEDTHTKKRIPQPDYRLDIVSRGPGGWYLARKVYFSRVDLRPWRELVYNPQGEVVSDVRYGSWEQHGEVWFPSVIEITRPIEEYQITIGMVKVSFNEPLADQQFALAEPSGVQVIHVNNGGLNAEDRAILSSQPSR